MRGIEKGNCKGWDLWSWEEVLINGRERKGEVRIFVACFNLLAESLLCTVIKKRSL